MISERLTRAGIVSPQAEAWQLLEAVTSTARARLLLEPRGLEPRERRELGEWLARRELREPLQQILGRAYFYGLEVQLEPGVLIPRPETEVLVEVALRAVRDVPAPRMIDVGCGSGAIALALKNERPDAVVMATDVESRALRVTGRNSVELGLPLALVASDLLTASEAAEFTASAHAVLSNPPYLPASDRDSVQPEVRWDPDAALYAGDDGLEVYRRLLAQARQLLKPGALLLVELDTRNIERARELAAGWTSSEIHCDLAGRARFLELRR